MSRNKQQTKPGNPEYKFRRAIVAAILMPLGAAGLAACGEAPVTTPSATASPTPGEQAPTTPGASPSAPEFEPGATGELSPEALSQLDEEALVERLKFTGSTPDELAQDIQDKLVAFLMSGTTDTELAPYAERGLGISVIKEYVRDMDEKYNDAACKAWGGFGESEDCKVDEQSRNLHSLILYAKAMNVATGNLYADFKLGPTKILSSEVTKGEFGSGTFTLDVVRQGTSNYKDSVMAWLAEGDGANTFGTTQEWSEEKALSNKTVPRDGFFTQRK